MGIPARTTLRPLGATIVEDRSRDLRSVWVRLERDFDFTATECIRCAEAGSHEDVVVVWAFLPALPQRPLGVAIVEDRSCDLRSVRVRLDRDFDFTGSG